MNPHLILPAAAESVRFFGPLNAQQIKEKLALIHLHFTAEQITDAIEKHLNSLPHNRKEFYYATGFGVTTYKNL